MFSRQVSKEAERAKTGAPVESLLARVPGMVFSEKCLATFVSCMREWMCMEGLRAIDEDVHMVFVKCQLMSGKFCLSSADYSGALMYQESRSLKSVYCVSKEVMLI